METDSWRPTASTPSMKGSNCTNQEEKASTTRTVAPARLGPPARLNRSVATRWASSREGRSAGRCGGGGVTTGGPGGVGGVVHPLEQSLGAIAVAVPLATPPATAQPAMKPGPPPPATDGGTAYEVAAQGPMSKSRHGRPRKASTPRTR